MSIWNSLHPPPPWRPLHSQRTPPGFVHIKPTVNFGNSHCNQHLTTAIIAVLVPQNGNRIAFRAIPILDTGSWESTSIKQHDLISRIFSVLQSQAPISYGPGCHVSAPQRNGSNVNFRLSTAVRVSLSAGHSVRLFIGVCLVTFGCNITKCQCHVRKREGTGGARHKPDANAA